MSDRELSEDYSQWPRDPFQLLGIDQNADARQMKRAYTALIRRFHPEDFPEHFRRIRAAYDAAQEYLLEEEFEASFEREKTAESRPSPETSGQDSIHEQAALRAQIRTAEIDAAWDLVVAGQVEEADCRLQKLAVEWPGNSAIWIRRYWIRLLVPNQNHQGSALEILETFLAEQIVDEVVYLYLSVLDRQRDAAVTDKAWGIAKKPEFRSWVTNLMRIRWSQLGPQGKWKQIEQELESFSGLALDYPIQWQTLNVIACEAAAFQGETGLGNQLLRRLGRLVDDALETDYYARMNHERAALLELILPEIQCVQLDSHRASFSESESLIRLLSGAALQSDDLFFSQLLHRHLTNWVRSPAKSLVQLDLLHSKSPGCTYELWNRISRICDRRVPGISSGEELIIRVQCDIQHRGHLRLIGDAISVMKFTGLKNNLTYDSLRQPLYDFCRQELVTLEQLASALSDSQFHPRKMTAEWLRPLEQDRSLAILVRGMLLFWS